MNILLFILVFILGISVGSFLNVLIDRIPREESFLKGRSHCDFCKHKLAWYDLVPLLSFISLSGKCRYCKKFIGFKYPLVELTTGCMFVAVVSPFIQNITFGVMQPVSLLQVVFDVCVFSAFIVIFYTDLWSGIIPDVVLFPIIGITVLYQFAQHPEHMLMYTLSGVGALLFFLALFLFTRGKGMGFGDVKLAFFLGILLGWPGIFLAIYAAFLTGAIVAIILILWGKKRFFGSTIPFGPFLILGSIIAMRWGPLLWQKILGFL